MNSLEALEKIKTGVFKIEYQNKELPLQSVCWEKETLEWFEQIRKDLTVLKILKKNLLDYLVFYTEILKGKLTQSEFDLIKEWLEREE